VCKSAAECELDVWKAISLQFRLTRAKLKKLNIELVRLLSTLVLRIEPEPT